VFADLFSEGAKAGEVRRDVASRRAGDVHPQSAEGASNLPSKAVVRRLVQVSGLQATG